MEPKWSQNDAKMEPKSTKIVEHPGGQLRGGPFCLILEGVLGPRFALRWGISRIQWGWSASWGLVLPSASPIAIRHTLPFGDPSPSDLAMTLPILITPTASILGEWLSLTWGGTTCPAGKLEYLGGAPLRVVCNLALAEGRSPNRRPSQV